MTMRTITVSHTISMGHRLPSYKGICSSPHGHNMTVSVEVGIRYSQFLDFKEVKVQLSLLLEPLDHAMTLWEKDPLLPILEELGFRVVPFGLEPTTENIAEWVFGQLSTKYDVQRITVQETANYSATRHKII